jgi:hypothetical protein
MQQFEFSSMPTAIDVTLYKYNYIDNKLWAQIQNDIDFIELGNDSIMVSASQLKFVLDTYYQSSINKMKSIGSDFIHKEINTVFFLYQILIEMENLQYIKFTLNKDKKYSRIIENDGVRMIQFSFKLLTATLRLYDLYDEFELPLVNKILEELEILEDGSHYSRLSAKDLYNTILFYLEEKDPEDVEAGIVTDILDILESKIEKEDPLLLLITDY